MTTRIVKPAVSYGFLLDKQPNTYVVALDVGDPGYPQMVAVHQPDLAASWWGGSWPEEAKELADDEIPPKIAARALKFYGEHT